MKSVILALAFLSTSAFAAGNLNQFVGKYKAEKGCGGDVAYGKLEYTKSKKLIGVSFSIYGNDPTGFGITLGRSEEENPNYTLGNPIQATIYYGAWDGDKKLVAKTSYVYGDDSVKLALTETLELVKGGVLYREISNTGKVVTNCKLSRMAVKL